MPDITPAQAVAIVASVLALAAAFGAPISAEQRGEILAFVGVVASVLIHSDAKIRHGRATGKPPRPRSSSPAADEPPDEAI